MHSTPRKIEFFLNFQGLFHLGLAF